jgi:hypothetical protein
LNSDVLKDLARWVHRSTKARANSKRSSPRREDYSPGRRNGPHWLAQIRTSAISPRDEYSFCTSKFECGGGQAPVAGPQPKDQINLTDEGFAFAANLRRKLLKKDLSVWQDLASRPGSRLHSMDPAINRRMPRRASSNAARTFRKQRAMQAFPTPIQVRSATR